MARKIGLIVVTVLIFWAPVNAEALDKRPPWQILDEALTYLHAVPKSRG